LLLDRKARLEDGTFTGMRPLHWAAASGHTDVVDFLLDRRARISATSQNMMQPIHHAAKSGKASVVELLCTRRAKVDAEVVNRRPIHFACGEGHISVVATLLDFGARNVLEDFAPKATLHKWEGTPIEAFSRAVERFRLQRDDAEEFSDRGQIDEATEEFSNVVAGLNSLSLKRSAASVYEDAKRCGISIKNASD